MHKQQAELLLKTAVGDRNAKFRDGQWESIDRIVNRRRKTMVVQRTGWGKSAVYFISTKIFRDQGMGPTIIISPLLVLMRNQVEAAQRLGISAVTINSSNMSDWGEIKTRIHENKVDAILISPERLSNEDFVDNWLLPIADRIGLFVVDEVHCISDWGHDFRPDYQRLVNILKQMPPNMPLLGTTATANKRVIEDVQQQLEDVEIYRGSLVRKSLSLQTIRMKDQPARLAWMAKHIPNLYGTGVVYTLTTPDADQVAEWLRQNDIDAHAYHARVDKDEFSSSSEYREHLEDQLFNNKIKVLVATTALGMGYDKPDIGFVIHYQAPGSIVAYYQQVGRAGRTINATGVLLSGVEDAVINRFFRTSAFPNEEQVNDILNVLAEHGQLSVIGIQKHLNLKSGQIRKVLKLISVENPAPVIKQGTKWARTPVSFSMDKERIERITQQREHEWQEVQRYIDSNTCLMKFLQESLDDDEIEDCGKCAICSGQNIVDTSWEQSTVNKAALFLRQADIPFKPKIQVAPDAFVEYGFSGKLPLNLRAQEGRILSRWRDAGWGEQVQQEKHAGHFTEDLVEAMATMLLDRWKPDPSPTWVTCVPSTNHPQLVPDFASRVATILGLPFLDVIIKKKANEPQKMQQNRFHQCSNLDGVFEVRDVMNGPVVLIDDIIHSGWTITVVAALLQQSGSGPVYPMALATADKT